MAPAFEEGGRGTVEGGDKQTLRLLSPRLADPGSSQDSRGE